MLQQLRDQTQSTGFKVLVIAIIVVLTLFGFGATNLFLASDPEVARVGDYSITQSVLGVETERERVRILGQMGPDFDASSIDRLQLQQYVVAQLVNRQIAYQTAQQLGVRTPAEAINESLVGNEAYHIDGVFNEALYRQYLSNLGYNPVDFLEEYTSAMSTEVVRGAVSEGVVLTDWELAEVVRVFGQTRDIAYLPLEVEQFAANVEVTDEDVEVRYEEQQANYMTELALDVAYLHLSIDELKDDPSLSVSDDEIQALYEEQRAAAMRDEQRDSSHILIQTSSSRDDAAAQALIESVAGRLADGEDFAELAAEFSEDPGSAQNGGSLGPVGKGIFDPAFESALWALSAPGDVSAPVKSSFGYHIIRLDAIVEQTYPPIEEQREQLAEQIRRTKALDLFSDRALELERSAYDEQYSLTATADTLDMPLQVAEGITRVGPVQPPLLGGQAVRSALFSDSVLDGLNSDAIALGEDEMLVVRVTQQHPPMQRPLDEVSDAIRAELKRERALAAIEEAKAGALARLQAGESVSEIAQSLNAQWQTYARIGRTPRPPADVEVPQNIRTFAFSLPRPPRGEKSVGAVDTESGAALVTVTRVISGDVNATSQADVNEIRRVAQERASRLTFQGLMQAAEDTLGVERPASAG